ncbi:MAG: GTPase Era [Bacteroidales bacterium]|nr:GTPase Era [Bacteroidales bacterium]
MHKSGFVNIVGNPNVGKSTLSNLLIGERLSIITSKAQTTRHRIFGIVNGSYNDGVQDVDYQIVFSDTPGVLKPNYKLQESMLNYSRSALQDADVLLYVTDTVETPDKHSDFLAEVEKLSCPIIVIINKIDLIDQKQLEEKVNYWHEQIPNAEIVPVSALHSFNTSNIIRHIAEMLPESDPYYDKDQLTDKPTRFFVNEIIREKILLYYKKEIPYSVEVEVEEFVESDDNVNIRAVIHVARDSQKGIIIGHQGVAIKKLGTLARRDIEKFLDKKVFLQLYVKVTKDWRDKDAMLKQFGYDVK